MAKGDAPSFETLYRRYRSKAYSIALTYMSSPQLAEDVLQDVFLQLWKKRETLVAIEKFDQYLFIVLRNKLISSLRQKNRQQKIKTHLEQMELLQPTPDQLSELNDLQQAIRQALQQLPEKQQRVYQMSRQQGLSHEQIAHQLQLSPRTVSNIITLVLNHLRDVLREKGYLAEAATAVILFFS